eukprot:1526591-Prymnesium_polylepis.1
MPHPILKPAVGMRMVASEAIAKALGIQTMNDDCDVPQRIVDIARRQKFKELTEADKRFITTLKHNVAILDAPIAAGSATEGTRGLLDLLKGIAFACGMALDITMENIVHPSATAKDGRVKVVKAL